MTNDDFYKMFCQAEEIRKRRNFDYFMEGLNIGLTSDLDKAYQAGDMEEYNRQLNSVKSYGIRVFRNEDGKHKIMFG